MNDLISRQAAIEVVYAIWDVTGDINVAKAWNQIIDLPSAQPERKKGKWMEDDTHSNWCDWTIYSCSECGCQFKDLFPRRFCPNCGADMRQQYER